MYVRASTIESKAMCKARRGLHRVEQMTSSIPSMSFSIDISSPPTMKMPTSPFPLPSLVVKCHLASQSPLCFSHASSVPYIICL
jgi:hypothetical protein